MRFALKATLRRSFSSTRQGCEGLVHVQQATPSLLDIHAVSNSVIICNIPVGLRIHWLILHFCEAFFTSSNSKCLPGPSLHLQHSLLALLLHQGWVFSCPLLPDLVLTSRQSQGLPGSPCCPSILCRLENLVSNPRGFLSLSLDVFASQAQSVPQVECSPANPIR